MALKAPPAPVDGGGPEALAHQRVAALAADEIQRQAAAHRPKRRARGVQDKSLLVLHHHPDHQQVGDLWQRKNRRIEKSDQEEARSPQCEREYLNPRDDSTHTINQ